MICVRYFQYKEMHKAEEARYLTEKSAKKAAKAAKKAAKAKAKVAAKSTGATASCSTGSSSSSTGGVGLADASEEISAADKKERWPSLVPVVEACLSVVFFF